MKNILFLTTMYPTPNSNFNTPVCHYFTKEWSKMGYNVKVIHYQSIFPIFFYWALSIFTKQATRFIGNDKNDTKRRTKDIHYTMDNVPVISIPIFKLIPHGKYTKGTISKHIRKILILNKTENFTPDAIIGHFYNPQLEIISKLKDLYPKAHTCIVLHENPELIKKTYTKYHDAYRRNIDTWGFRSKKLKNDFENTFGKTNNSFICYSGVPKEYISPVLVRDFSRKISKFIFVGQLIELKHPCAIIHALHIAFPEKQYEMTFVGKGYKEIDIIDTAKLLDVTNNVQIIGEINRDQVIKHYDDSDCFIMISKPEVFGLVYLEAMARGCITIGSRNEGIDGVIQNGLNGFLCEAGNSDELAEILKHINSLSSEELINISENAIKTAHEFTDSKVAKKYIDAVFVN